MNNNPSKIITRFPPSPTGWFHIGNARTALFNYFFTKQQGGTLLFRLEDTDRKRSKDEYALDIIEGLQWLGIELDFDHVYKQSEHAVDHRRYLEKLIAENKAYISKEVIDPNKEWKDGAVQATDLRNEVIRLRNPGKIVVFEDMIRGEVSVDTTELGDFIIAKSIDEPLYHLAVVVDDFEMGVTHVIRGEDGIYNTPRQILIQEAIGAPRPIYAHMPFILNEDRSKLSKRKQGELVSLKYYREQGYLPEAVVNYLALCGWHPDATDEIMSMNEIVKRFDIMKVQKAGAVFDKQKLLWMNKEYLKKLPIQRIVDALKNRLPADCQDMFMIARIAPIILERISVFSDIDALIIAGETRYFFLDPSLEKTMLIWKKNGTEAEAKENLSTIVTILSDIDTHDFSKEILEGKLMPVAIEKGKGNVLWPLRVSLSGREKSPDPFTLLATLGKEVSIRRIKTAIAQLA